MKKAEIRHQPWIHSADPPSKDMERTMFCEAVAVMVKKTMRLHDFVVDGVIYRQRKGGAIGMDLTGVVSDICMCHWDQQLIAKLQETSMDAILYKRY